MYTVEALEKKYPPPSKEFSIFAGSKRRKTKRLRPSNQRCPGRTVQGPGKRGGLGRGTGRQRPRLDPGRRQLGPASPQQTSGSRVGAGAGGIWEVWDLLD